MRSLLCGCTAAALAAVGAVARAQVAVSANYFLIGDEFVAVSGGGSSAGSGQIDARVAFAALGSLAPGASASMNAQEFSAFLALFDPLGGSGPLVFSVEPVHGGTLGGTTITVVGARFQTSGSAQLGLGVVPTRFDSATRVTVVTPPSMFSIPEGPVDLMIVDAGGSTTKPGGFLYTPAVLASDGVIPGNRTLVRHVGEVGGFYWSLGLEPGPPTIVPGISGFLQLTGPTIVYTAGDTYGPDGFKDMLFTSPPDPSLSGQTFYWQDLAVFPSGAQEFSNLASTTFL